MHHNHDFQKVDPENCKLIFSKHKPQQKHEREQHGYNQAI
jgi:hypothetical protein